MIYRKKEKKSQLTSCNNNVTGSQKEKNNIKENFSFHDPIKLRAVGIFGGHNHCMDTIKI